MTEQSPPRRVYPFLAHRDGTTSASFSPDGQTLATGGYDCVVRLWEVATWEERATLPGHRRGHVAFSPDGAVLVSGGLHKNATVYEVGTQEAVRTLYNTSGVWDLAFAPTGSRIAIIQPNGFGDDPERPIELRDTRTWRTAGRAGVGAVYVNAVAFHPDGERAAIAGAGIVSIWSADFARKLTEFAAHEQATWGLAFSPDGASLATGGADNVARLWDTATWEVRHELGYEEMSEAGHQNGVLCAAFSPDGGMLVTGGLDRVLTVWRL